MDVFKTAQKFNIHLSYFCKKIYHQKLSKIAKSGHTALFPSAREREYVGRYAFMINQLVEK